MGVGSSGMNIDSIGNKFIKLRTNDVDCMMIHGDGNVSIGTTAVQNAKFHIAHNKGSAGNLWTQVGPNNNMSAYIQNLSSTDNTNACLYFGNDSGATAAINARFLDHSTDETELRFSTHDGTNPRERMYMTGAGKLGLNLNPKSRNAGYFVVQSTNDNGGIYTKTGTYQEYKNVYTTHTAATNTRYWHIKTNFKCSNNIMFVARVHGYNYGSSGHIIDVQRSGYAYSGGSVINSQTKNNGTGAHTLATYIADDDYVVFRFDGIASYYNGLSLDIKMPSPTGYAWDFKVLAQHLNDNSGDYY